MLHIITTIIIFDISVYSFLICWLCINLHDITKIKMETSNVDLHNSLYLENIFLVYLRKKLCFVMYSFDKQRYYALFIHNKQIYLYHIC